MILRNALEAVADAHSAVNDRDKGRGKRRRAAGARRWPLLPDNGAAVARVGAVERLAILRNEHCDGRAAAPLLRRVLVEVLVHPHEAVDERLLVVFGGEGGALVDKMVQMLAAVVRHAGPAVPVEYREEAAGAGRVALVVDGAEGGVRGDAPLRRGRVEVRLVRRTV